MYGAYSLLFYVAIAKDVCYYTSILSPISKLYAQRLKGMRPQGVYILITPTGCLVQATLYCW